jgi:predicted TIM-barrel fold metal-dependent hydrolase
MADERAGTMADEPKAIDFHTHAFPDALARRAMEILTSEAGGIKAYLDGTLGALDRAMHACGIGHSVVCCIATKPSQFDSILQWCRQVRSDTFSMMPSVHPADPDRLDRIRQVKAAGFKGIKLHPFYQDFHADEDRLLRMYEVLCQEDLLVVMHTGYDIAFPRQRRADPEKLVRIRRTFPGLKLVATHLGAWQQWDEVEALLVGSDIHMEISFSLESLDPRQARRILLNHPSEYILFGTDSPWTDQANTLRLLRALDLPEDRMDRITRGNAAKLLGLG